MRNKYTGNIFKPGIDKYGYPRIVLVGDSGKRIYKTIHRLVAETWIPNPLNLPQVNHQNGNKTVNSIENLEWSTVRWNIIHSYENKLNQNANSVLYEDLELKEFGEFRSIKDFAKHIGIHLSVLVPLIKWSKQNPIIGRFVVRVKDESALWDRANTLNFGRSVFVFDELTGLITKYPSSLIASYFTGIRSLSNLTRLNGYFKIHGYHCSFDKNNVSIVSTSDKAVTEANRLKYLLTPYKGRSIRYYLYNYFSKIELSFENISALIDYLSLITPIDRVIKNKHISQILGDASKRCRTDLIKGYGIRSDNLNYEWHPYNEEIIICNKLNMPMPKAVFRVTNNCQNTIVIGRDEVLRIQQLYNIPNHCVVRLNKPIIE